MSIDYYQILQVSTTATHAEIKASYRRLAKLFHPDKNSGFDDKFRLIKEAYETLIDEVQRNRYDVKRNYDITISQVKKTEPVKKQKTYTFTEPELKHRNYYQEHYKPKQKQAGYNFESKKKTSYKELTYILISIPAAISLLLLLVSLYQKPSKEKAITEKKTIVSEIKTSESPYSANFGRNIFNSSSKSYLKITNQSKNDVIVFLQNKDHKIIRHHFIEHGYRLFIEEIPAGTYYLFYYSGKGFTDKKYLFNNIMGNFYEAWNVDSFPQKINIIETKQDSFLFSLPKKEQKKLDTLLLKRIFDFN